MNNKVLIIGPSWVGDMVMAQSLFKTLKALDPTATIDVLAPLWSAPLLERMPEVRQAHPMPVGHGALALRQRYQIAQSLKPYAYDKAIVLPNSWKSALIPWWARIPKRVGFLGECRFGLLNDVRRLNKVKCPRLIDRYATLAYEKNTPMTLTVPYPRLMVQTNSVEAALLKFSIGDIERPILALCPGAEFGSSKRWPESYYAKIAVQKQKEGWSVWLFGSKNDAPVAARIKAETTGHCLDLTGKTTLAEAIDLLSLAKLVVTNDSGLMHIAAALQKPLVAVYGSTDPAYTPPLGENAKIVRVSISCSPCFKRECPLGHHHCMQTLYPDKVLSLMRTLEA